MIKDGVYSSLLHGVSQQSPQLRREGQLGGQVNMLSDPVTGLRRRPGTFRVNDQIHSPAYTDSIMSFYYKDQAGAGYNVLVNAATGMVTTYSDGWDFHGYSTFPYLKATSANKLRVASVGGSTFLLNTEEVVTTVNVTTPWAPNRVGWFSIQVGVFSKAYSVTVKCDTFTRRVTHTTPDGTTAGDADLATPSYIAQRMADALNADAVFNVKYTASRLNGSVFIYANSGINPQFTSITSDDTFAFVLTSGTMEVDSRDRLPALLPDAANGAIMAVGTSERTTSYFKWTADGTWVETAEYGSDKYLDNMPLEYKVVGGVASLAATYWEGRTSGNAVNNPYPAFVGSTITGISAYQGRLVLLAGAYVCLSASSNPRRFMRPSVITLENSDPIEISTGALQGTAFEYAVPYNKDLLLFSKDYHAVVPAGSSAITPYNARVVVSTSTQTSMGTSPVVVGRSLYYATSNSAYLSPSRSFGVGEVASSEYTESLYTANVMTSHIPTYCDGVCSKIVVVDRARLALFLNGTNRVVVNQYLWDANERVQNAWHEWVFSNAVVSAHVTDTALVLIMLEVSAGVTHTVHTVIDLIALTNRSQASDIPFLDEYCAVPVANNTAVVPSYIQPTKLLDGDAMLVERGSSTMPGEPIGVESVNGALATTVRSYAQVNAWVGYPYSSRVTLTAPYYRDREGRPITTAQTNVLKYKVNVQYTGAFQANIASGNVAPNYDLPLTGLLWGSNELGLGNVRTVDYGSVIVPVRAESDLHTCTLQSDSVREFNIISVEYTIRGVSKRTRG